MAKRRSILTAFTVLTSIALPIPCVGQRLDPPIVVPFERAPPPYLVIRVPVASGPCEAFLFDTGTNTTLLAPALAAEFGLSRGRAGVVEDLHGLRAATTGEVQGIGFDKVPATGPRVAAALDVPSLPGFGRAVTGVYGHNWLMGVDYLIDYGAQRIVIGARGTLAPSEKGHRTALSWTEGLPAVTGEIRAPRMAPFSARFVLDSGADHVTLFGRAAERILPHGPSQSVLIDSGFATRQLPTARIIMNLDGRPRSILAVLMPDVKNRDEDGLVPASFFRSVFVSGADGFVIFDASLSGSSALERTTVCR